MKPFRSRPWPVAVVALSLLSAPGAAYAASRPHTHDDLVAHVNAVPETTPFPTSGLPVGSAPTIPYAFASEPDFGEGNWRLERPDGTSVRLPRLTWSAWAPMGNGAIGMAGTEAGPELQRVSGAGDVRTRMVEHFGLEVSPDHEIVGWLGDRGRPQVVEGAGTRHFAMARVRHSTAIGAVSGTQTCQEEDPEGGGCTVFVHRGRHVWVSTSHGIVSRVGPVLRVSDVNQRGRVLGLAARRTSEHPDCWAVFRPDRHRIHRVHRVRRFHRTCDYFLHAFSPDGHRILAERSQTRFWSVRRFAVLGRDGHVVRAWTFDASRHRSLSQLTWEDPHHLLGVLLAHGQWALVRIGTDGTVEHAAPTVDATDEFTPFSLPVR